LRKKPFAAKQPVLVEKSKVYLNNYFKRPELTRWDKEAIMERGWQLAQHASRVWAGPPTTNGGTQSKYPWDEWFCGKLLLLERSDVDKDGNLTPSGTKRDFEVERDAMPGKLKTAARRRYKVVQISKRDADGNKLTDALIIRARDMTVEERERENIRRIEEMAAGVPRLPRPQARVLQALLPVAGETPSLSRTELAQRMNVSPISGLISVALGGRSDSPHKGLLDAGLVTKVKGDGNENVYQITIEGIRIIEDYLKKRGKLPPPPDKTLNTNIRYQK